MPILKWLPAYQRAWFAGDLVAGATVWAVLVPLALAYGSVAGVDPVIGLYGLPLALLGYVVFGGSRLLVVGPDAAVAVLSGGIVASIAVGGGDFLALTVALALIVGLLYAVLFILKMGWIADMIPDPVLKGFVEGVVWLTILKQFGVLFGIDSEGSPQGFPGTFAELVRALPGAQIATMFIGAASILTLVLFKRFAPRLPGPVFVLAGSIILVGVFALDEAGVAVLGEVTGGRLALGLPTGITLSQFITLISGALAIVVLGYTKSLAALRRAAEQSGEPIDPDRELLAIGVSNIGAGLGGGYAVAGSLTATAVSIDAGAKTQIANLAAGVLCVLTIVFMLPLLADLAMSSLAAIIVVAMAGLSDLGYFRGLWTMRRDEFITGAATFAGVLVFDVMAGVAVGVVLALFRLAAHIHTPVTTAVGRTPSGMFVDLDEYPKAREIPGMLIWRQYGPLVFLNARMLSDRLRAAALERDGIRVIVIDATASAGIDSTAANALIGAMDDLGAIGIDLWVVAPRQKGWNIVVAVLQTAKAAIPPVFASLADATARFEKSGTARDGPDGPDG
jgi:sulfate permease, SulP family